MVKAKEIFSLIFFFFPFSISYGQLLEIDESKYKYSMSSTDQKIIIDGELTEQIWSRVEVMQQFWLQAPVDNKRAEVKTEVRMTYDRENLYVAAVCYDNPPYVIQTLKRDNFGESDAFAIVLDPVGKKTNGYGFGVNVQGAQTEALIVPNGSDDSWDNKWSVSTHQYEDRWTVEMAIPFKSMRFDKDNKVWGVNFTRIEPGSNEVHVWHPVPRQFEFSDLGYYGTMIWEEPPETPGSNISLIPYSTLRSIKSEGQDQDAEIDFGGDAKIGLTSSMNLDLTINPDFSQVEVDRQVTNLTRFNIFFPERRQFFIENADIFGGFGQGANQPFYSRRIGLDPTGRTVPILYGARATGNISPKTRLGVFNIHSRSDDDFYGQNFSAFALHQRVGQRSLIKGLLLNRQAFDGSESITGDYNRNVALVSDLSTSDGKWQGGLGYLQSFKEGIKDKNRHIHGSVFYNGTNFRTFLQVQHLGANYFTDMGFNARILNFNPINGEVVRIGYSQIGNMMDYYYYPGNSDMVNFHWSGLENFVWISDDGYGLTEWYTRLRHFIFFKNTSQLRFRLNNHYVDLIFPFNLTEVPLPAKQYNMTEFNIQYNTDVRRRLLNTMFVVYGEFYAGTKLTLITSFTYRVQPWGNFAVELEYNDIRMPDPYGNLSLTLASARSEINFSTSLFWTTFLQYNTQADNFNINSRLQWRFSPMSDVFLVYTDNYRIENMFGSKERTIALKVNYWLSI